MRITTESQYSSFPRSSMPASTCLRRSLFAWLWILALLSVHASGISWDRRNVDPLPAAVPLLAPTGAPSTARPPSSSSKKLFVKDIESKSAGSKTTKRVKRKKKRLSDNSNAKSFRSNGKRKVKVRKVLAKRSSLASHGERSDGSRHDITSKSAPGFQNQEKYDPKYPGTFEGQLPRKSSPKTRLVKRTKRRRVVVAEGISGANKSVELPTSSSTVDSDGLQNMERKKIKKVRKRKVDAPIVDVVSSNDDKVDVRPESNVVTISIDSGNISSPLISDDGNASVPFVTSDADEPIISSSDNISLSIVLENDDSASVTKANSTDQVEIEGEEASHDGASTQPIDNFSSAPPKVEVATEYLYLAENASSTTEVDVREKVVSLKSELIDSANILSQLEISKDISSSIDGFDQIDVGSNNSLASVSFDMCKNSSFTILSSPNASYKVIQADAIYEIEGHLPESGEFINDKTPHVHEERDSDIVDALNLLSEEASQPISNRHSETIAVEDVATRTSESNSSVFDGSQVTDLAFTLRVGKKNETIHDDGINVGSESISRSLDFDDEDDGGDGRTDIKSNADAEKLDDEDDDDDEGSDAHVTSENVIETSHHDNEASETPSRLVEFGSVENSGTGSFADADASTSVSGFLEPSTNLSESVFDVSNKENVHVLRDNVTCAEFKPDLTVSVVTWNLAEESPMPEDALFIKNFRDKGNDNESGSDLVLISGQECENIKPRRTEGSRSREFRRLMILMLGKNYVPLAMHLLGGIQFCLFCKRSILPDIEKASVADVTCGIGNVFHNKGAIGCFLQLKANNKSNIEGLQRKSKSVRMLFVTAHMAAHVKNMEARDSDFWRIVRELEIQAPASFLPKRNSDTDATGRFLLESMDRIFFCGDLNYRIDLPREEVEYAVQRIRSLTESGNPKALSDADEIRQSLLQYDQLRATIALGRAFPGFAEGRITFAPTFKFDKGTDDYDTSPKQRIPAWTDRILFKPVGTQVSMYNSVATARHSDHRPVFATFLVDLTARDRPLGIRKRKRAAGTRRKKAE